MKKLLLSAACAAAIAHCSGLAAGPAAEKISSDEREIARTYLSEMEDSLTQHYFPTRKTDAAFHARCRETLKHLDRAQTSNQAYGLIADAFAALDPRIRFYPPQRSSIIDYGWMWKLFGDHAYVSQVDHVGDAATQGLRPGDQVLAIEGQPVTRENFQQISYAFDVLAPSQALRVRVQSPGAEPRDLTIAATMRKPLKIRTYDDRGSKNLEFAPTERQSKRLRDFRDLKNHIRHIGDVVVWRADELRHRIGDVADGLSEARDASALILDLRGQYVRRNETTVRLLDGLFAESFTAGTIEMETERKKLNVSGGTGSFHGTVLVLVDAQTGLLAEFIARVIQWKKRGVIIGDRTMGRVLDESLYIRAQGLEFNFTNAFILIPTGEITLGDGSSIDGRGVFPDMRVLPKPADLAGKRDVVLAKALAVLKQNMTPEDAWKLFDNELEDEDR
jgi:carboxyl-terminal processing protease